MNIGAVIKTTITCVILGPLIGVFVFAGPLLFVYLDRSDFLFFIFMAYVGGAVPALSVGVMLSVVGWHLRYLPFWTSAIAGIISFLGWIIFLYLMDHGDSGSDIHNFSTIIIILNLHVLSAVGCWVFVKRFWGQTEMSNSYLTTSERLFTISSAVDEVFYAIFLFGTIWSVVGTFSLLYRLLLSLPTRRPDFAILPDIAAVWNFFFSILNVPSLAACLLFIISRYYLGRTPFYVYLVCGAVGFICAVAVLSIQKGNLVSVITTTSHATLISLLVVNLSSAIIAWLGIRWLIDHGKLA
jgi:hypothetical protein